MAIEFSSSHRHCGSGHAGGDSRRLQSVWCGGRGSRAWCDGHSRRGGAARAGDDSPIDGTAGPDRSLRGDRVYARVPGYVEKWTVDIGAKVTKGQALAVLAVPELDAEAEQKQAMIEEAEAKRIQAKAAQEVAEANLVSAQAKLVEVKAGTKRADADLARWQAEFKRVEQLFQEHAQTGSLVDETRSKLRASESTRDEVYAQGKTAEAAVRQSEAMLAKARADLTAATASIKVARSDAHRVQALRQFATIVAPYNGVVTRRHVDVGDLTEPGNHGEPLFMVARDDIVRINVSVPEMYATEVEPGNRA